jgi:predicted metal-dependent peptidase
MIGMNDNEYHLRINQVHDYLDGFESHVHEKFEKECGVAYFGPHMENTPENKAELQEKYPRTWREAFAKFKKAVEAFIAEAEHDESLPDGERMYAFGDDEIKGSTDESPVIMIRKDKSGRVILHDI